MLTTYSIVCKSCQEKQYILASPVDVEKWMDGVKIQDALPYLTPDERELIITNICPTCWTKLFGEEE